MENSNAGVAVGNAARVMITRSVFTGNTVGGVEIIATTAAEVDVDQIVSSSNGVGLSTSGAATMRISNSDIVFNATAINGATLSFGNNRMVGNAAAGTATTPIGSDAPAKGQLYSCAS